MKSKIITFSVVLFIVVGLSWHFSTQQQKDTDIVRIAYLPVTSGLPLYVALEEGYFNDAGINVEPIKINNPNLIIDALLAGRVEFGGPSTAMGITALSQLQKPGTLEIAALSGGTSPDKINGVLLVGEESPLKTLEELKGKRLGILPGIQFRTIAQHIFANTNIDIENDVSLVELPIPLQLQALSSGQVDALLTLEPIKTIGKTNNSVKDLVVGPMIKYIADPWYGGATVVRTDYKEENPEVTEKVLLVFERAMDTIRNDPKGARKYLINYTPLTEELADEVPLLFWKMYNDFTPSDIEALQEFVNIFSDHGVIDQPIDVSSLIYTPS